MIGTLIKSAEDKKKTSWANIIFEYKLFSKEDKTKDGRRDMGECMLSRVWLFATLWIIAHQALLSMKFSRQEYWSGLLCSPPGDLPDPGIEPESHLLQWQADSLPLAPPGKPCRRTSSSELLEPMKVNI